MVEGWDLQLWRLTLTLYWWLSKGGRGSPCGSLLVKKTRPLLELEWEVVFQHSYRKINQCAYVLANLVSSVDSNVIFFFLLHIHLNLDIF